MKAWARLALFGLALAGCTDFDDALVLAQLSLDGTQAAAATAQSTFLGGFVFSSVTTQDPDAAAFNPDLPDNVKPKGCATWVAAPHGARAAIISFDECDGPLELENLRGALAATFDARDDGTLDAALTGDELVAKRAGIDFTARIGVVIDGSLRAVDWSAKWIAPARSGTDLVQSSRLTLLSDQASDCLTLSGEAVTEVDGRHVETTITDYHRCRTSKGEDTCPSGTLLHHRDGRRVTVVFDGTKRAELHGFGAETLRITVDCKEP